VLRKILQPCFREKKLQKDTFCDFVQSLTALFDTEMAQGFVFVFLLHLCRLVHIKIIST
jgi:hypothetical protein